MSRLTALFDLQQVDSQIDHHHTSLARIEATLADTSALDAARQELTEAEAALRLARSKQRDLEFEAETAEKHAADLEKKVNAGLLKTAKEIQKAQQEIQNFRQRRKELDDQTVEAMEEVESDDNRVKSLKAKLSEVEAGWEKSTALLKEDHARLEGEIPGLRAEREKLAGKVFTDDKPVYERLRTSKQGVAVAEVIMGKTCGKCRVEFPLTKQREARNHNALTFCPSCGRILYMRVI